MLKTVLTLLTFLIASGLSSAEQVQLQTYYPSPYGIYKRVKLTPTTLPACDSGILGSIAVSQTAIPGSCNANELCYCGTLGWTSVGGSAGAWTRSAPNLYPTSLTDNVGIGTNTPQQKLSVSAGMNIDQANANSGSTTNALTFGSSSGEGIASKRTGVGGLNGLDFYTGSANRMSITSSGDIGIRTNSPSTTLDINGSLRIRSGTPTTPGYVLTSTGTDGTVSWQAGGGISHWDRTAPNLYPHIITDNVGIGTVSPQQKLSVQGGMNIDQGNTNSGTPTNSLTFGSSSGEGIASQRTVGGNQNGLDFYTGSARRVSITNSGAVGIGTTNPIGPLHVESSTTRASIYIKGSGAPGWLVASSGSDLGSACPPGGYYCLMGGPGQLPYFVMSPVGVANIGSLTAGTAMGTVPRIPGGLDAAAQFSSPTGTIASYGPAIFSDFNNTGGYGRILHTGAAGNFHIDSYTNGTYINFYSGNGVVIGNGSAGAVNSGYGNIDVWQVNEHNSSRKIKADIKNISYGLKDISKLEPIEYNLKHYPDKHEIGFIAEDIVKIFPEVVNYDKDGHPDGINYERITPVLVKAIQEQQEEIKKLRAEIESLKNFQSSYITAH